VMSAIGGAVAVVCGGALGYVSSLIMGPNRMGVSILIGVSGAYMIVALFIRHINKKT